jgi:hypothetical protein
VALKTIASYSRKIPILLCIAAFNWFGCVSSVDPGFEIADPPHEDNDYYAKYKRATRGGDLIYKFDVNYRVNATFLSPEFRAALVKRVEKLYLQDAGGAFQEASSKAGFIVTVYGLDRDTVDLTNTNHWTLQFDSKEGAVKPILVKKISDKIRWRNFFETMTPWTSDFLVVFDRAAVNPQAENLVEKPMTRLTLANGIGKIQLDW